MKFIITKNYEDFSRKIANIISAQVILKPNSVLGLATGSTPIGAYKQLIEWYNKGDIDFSEITTINLDEYCGLEPNNVMSYHYYMNHNLFSHININKENTYIPNGLSHDLTTECLRYDSLLTDFGGIDLQLLGIGLNGHIGFNEPGISFEKTTHIVDLDESTIKANSRFFDSINEVPKQAITMGIKSIMQAKKVLLASYGTAKQDIVSKALQGPVTPDIPASILQFHPDLTVVCCFE